jgi:hypothetical protein
MFRLFRILLTGAILALAACGQTDVHRYVRGSHFLNFPSLDDSRRPDPDKNHCSPDRSYGSEVCKAVDVSEVRALNPSLSAIRPSYMRWANDNADGSKYFLFVNGEIPKNTGRGHMRIFRTSDNSFFDSVPWPSHENYEPRWDDSDPNVLYHVKGCALYSYNVATRQDAVIHDFAADFPGCRAMSNGVEGTSSTGSRYWTWMIKRDYAHGHYYLAAIIVYDKQADRIVGILDKQKYVSQGGSQDLWDSGGYGPNMVDMAPSGDRVLLLWPALKYPSGSTMSVSADKVEVRDGGKHASVYHPGVNRSWMVGDSFLFAGCSGPAGGLNGLHRVAARLSDYNTLFEVTGSLVADGLYTCSTIRQALVSISVKAGLATAEAGFQHQLQPGDSLVVAGAPATPLNGSVTVLGTPSPREFTYKTTAPDGVYRTGAPAGMIIRWREGEKIPDGLFRFPRLKPNNQVANDGPHVYNLDFSNPVKVCNDETHSGWAWALNGDPVYVCQINDRNWAQAEADTVGFTNIYTGVYTPVFFHADLNYQGGWHFGRLYNRDIRGWAVMTVSSQANDTNRLRDSLVIFELKKWTAMPRFWRVAKLHLNYYGYDTEGHGNLTRNGLRFIWGANWNGDSKSPINTYTVKLPDRWWTKLSASK